MDTKTTFPDFFWSMYEHMILIQLSETQFELVPPNQSDWFWTLTKVSDTEWKVYGTKDDFYYGDYPQNRSMTYFKAHNEWCLIDVSSQPIN